jgi:hypothetical protein
VAMRDLRGEFFAVVRKAEAYWEALGTGPKHE